jgi:hypothetical protein
MISLWWSEETENYYLQSVFLFYFTLRNKLNQSIRKLSHSGTVGEQRNKKSPFNRARGRANCRLIPATLAIYFLTPGITRSKTRIAGSNPTQATNVCLIYSVFVLFCVEVAASRRTDPPSKESNRLCIGLKDWKSGQVSNNGLYSHREIGTTHQIFGP